MHEVGLTDVDIDQYCAANAAWRSDDRRPRRAAALCPDRPPVVSNALIPSAGVGRVIAETIAARVGPGWST